MTEKRIGPGFYERDARTGELRQVTPAVPDVKISRRLIDFPDGRKPDHPRARLATCSRCEIAVVTDDQYLERPIICMQCAGIQPLPIGRATEAEQLAAIVAEARRQVAEDGATHDCGEWIADGRCKLCGREV